MRKEIIVKPKGSGYWFTRSDEEMRRIKKRDVDAGIFLDSSGEPIIYSRLGYGQFAEDTIVTITKKRGAFWPSHRKRPSHLVEGLATIDGKPTSIVFIKKEV